MPPAFLPPAVVIVREIADIAQHAPYYGAPSYIAPPVPDVQDGPDTPPPEVLPPITGNANLTDGWDWANADGAHDTTELPA